MGWRVGLRNQRGVLVAILLLAISLTLAGSGQWECRNPGVDETIFDPVIKRPQTA